MFRLFLLFALLFSFSFAPTLSTIGNSPSISTINTVEKVVYVTKTGKKYHKASCHHLRQSKIKTTQTEAKKQGYTACKVCKP